MRDAYNPNILLISLAFDCEIQDKMSASVNNEILSHYEIRIDLDAGHLIVKLNNRGETIVQKGYSLLREIPSDLKLGKTELFKDGKLVKTFASFEDAKKRVC